MIFDREKSIPYIYTMSFNFPQYRKLANGKSYYKILDAGSMEEIQLIGDKYAIHNLKASILPERLLIQDMLDLQDGLYQIVEESEFIAIQQRCESELKRVFI